MQFARCAARDHSKLALVFRQSFVAGLSMSPYECTAAEAVCTVDNSVCLGPYCIQQNED